MGDWYPTPSFFNVFFRSRPCANTAARHGYTSENKERLLNSPKTQLCPILTHTTNDEWVNRGFFVRKKDLTYIPGASKPYFSWFPYLPKCPVSFGWTFGPVGRLRVLSPSEISTKIRRRRWSLVSSFLAHKGYALRKATATIRALLLLFSLRIFPTDRLCVQFWAGVLVCWRCCDVSWHLLVEVEGSWRGRTVSALRK